MWTGRLVENIRALLCINSSVGISSICTTLRDDTGNIITVDQEEFPDVDCNEVFPNIFVGNM